MKKYNVLLAVIMSICFGLVSAQETPANRIGKPKRAKELLDSDKVGLYPVKTLTPGKVNDKATAAIICAPDFLKDRLPLTDEVKVKVLENYQAHFGKLEKAVDYKKEVLEKDALKDEVAYEIDHLVPPLLGGTDDLENLWPQPAQHVIAGANDKNALIDSVVHAELCNQPTDKTKKEFLKQTQDQLVLNWYKMYWERFEAKEIKELEEKKKQEKDKK